MAANSVIVTILFTDLEGSTRLWEQDAPAMRVAVARHDEICRDAVTTHGGRVVKMVGDGLFAVFADPLDAVQATLALQRALSDPGSTGGTALRARCGLHVGAVEARGDDFFGPPVNRTARIMGVAHGGQVLLSETVCTLVGERWPTGVGVRDLGAVRLRDLAAPQRLFQLLASDLPAEFPALRSLEASPTNLPQQLTSFVGRGAEVQALHTRLSSARLVTLTGAGGIGKTRLALQAGAEALDLFADGVWLVELATLGSAELVVPTVAGVLGVREQPGRTPLQALQAHLDTRQTLLILDNCEHMLEGVAELVEQLLGATTGLKVLATSREALRAAGEQVLPLEPLAAPEAPGARGQPDVAALAQLPAVRMFVDRAQAARPDFELTADNEPDVAEICRTLDGLPLAIELAAARLGTMSAAQLRQRLADRFRVLRGGRRLAPPRQQTLEALIDWSHDLLGPEEQVLLRRLGVFAGSFPAESAQAVAAWGELDAADIEDTLDALAAKSLVVARPEQGRYVLLETLRAYARQRLERAGEMQEARERHMGVMLERLERHRTEVDKGVNEAEALRALDEDQADVLEGFAWTTRSPGNGSLALDFVAKLYVYNPQRGQVAFGLEQAKLALCLPDGQQDSPNRTFALFVAGQYSAFLGRRSEATRYLQQSLTLGRRLGLQRYEAMATNALAAVMHEAGDPTGALVYAKRAVELAHQAGDSQEVTNALANFAMHLRGAGRLIDAQAALEEVLVRSRSAGRRSVTAVVLLNLAMVTLDRGRPNETLEALGELIPLLESLQSPMLAACLLDVVAALLAGRNDDAAAAQIWAQADALYASCGVLRDGPDADFVQRWRKPENSLSTAAAEDASTRPAAQSCTLPEALARAKAILTEFQARPTDPGSHTPSPAA